MLQFSKIPPENICFKILQKKKSENVIVVVIEDNISNLVIAK